MLQSWSSVLTWPLVVVIALVLIVFMFLFDLVIKNTGSSLNISILGFKLSIQSSKSSDIDGKERSDTHVS